MFPHWLLYASDRQFAVTFYIAFSIMFFISLFSVFAILNIVSTNSNHFN